MEIVYSKEVAYWCDQINTYEKDFSRWRDRSKKIIKRYKDERGSSNNTSARYNILWSNIETLKPALFSKNPIPNVDRRFEDDDKVGTMAARILERSVTYFVDNDLFTNVMSQVVLDRLLPGRGTAWVRYVPNFVDEAVEGPEDVREEGAQITDDTELDEYPEEKVQDVDYEDVIVDYVHWEDFGHSCGRTWEEVNAVWRKVYLTKAELKERFPNVENIPIESDESEKDKTPYQKACVYEIWDKSKRQAIWINKSVEEPLDKRDDPLGLKDFFPCPKPVFATLGNDNLVPTPDFVQYQDQATELDNLTARIASITKALKVVGVYNASAEGLSRLLSEGLENTMVPVEQWAVFGEKGGLKGSVDFLPIEMVVNTLISLYQARDSVKQDLYEISGISDIIRGAGNPNETATAQKIKGQFATLRLDGMQKDVARFSRDLVRIMAEIISEHFSIETIKKICGIRLLTQAEKQIVMMQQQATQQELPPEMQEMLENPTWEEVEALIKNDALRSFRISIETDSTIKTDQEAEKASRIELIGSVGQFLQQAVMLPPTLQPLAASLLMFGVRGFKVSREIETTFDVAMKKIQKAADAPPQPDPEEAKLQGEAELEKQKLSIEQARLSSEVQAKMQEVEFEGARLQLEREKLNMDIEAKRLEFALKTQELERKGREHDAGIGMELTRIEADKYKTRMDAKTKAHPDVAMSDPEINEMGATPMTESLRMLMEMMASGFQQMAELQAKGDMAIIQAVTQPRVTEVIRGPDGRIVSGVSTITSETMQ